MTERKRRFFSGPSLEAALVAAASEYGIPPEDVNYRVVEKRHGFLKIRRNVVIQVDPEAPRKQEAKEEAQQEAERAKRKAAGKAPGQEPPGGRRPPRESGKAAEDGVEEAAEGGAEPVGGAPEERTGETAGDRRVSDMRPPLRPRRREKSGEEKGAPEAREGRGSEAREPKPREPEGRRRGRRREEPTPQRSKEGEADEGQRREGGRRRRPRLEPPKPIEERLKRARGEKAEAALEATEWLLDLVDLDVDPEIYEGEDRYEVELRGEDRDLLTPDNGKVLSALEHLIPRVMRGVCGDTHAVRVDSENFQELREDRLRELAWDTADKVRREGQATILEAMDPADRRIVHIAVSDDPEVTTRSLGDGFFKRVKVLPK